MFTPKTRKAATTLGLGVAGVALGVSGLEEQPMAGSMLIAASTVWIAAGLSGLIEEGAFTNRQEERRNTDLSNQR